MTTISRLIVTTFSFMLISLFVSAQTSVGVHGGVTFSDMSSASFATDFLDGILPHPKRMVGTKFGVFSEFPLNQHFTFQTGLDYTDKGFSIRENINLDIIDFPVPVGATINARIKYIEVPLVAKYALMNGPVKPYLKAGATIGYASSSRIETKARVIVPINIATIPIGLNSSLYNRFEVGALIGGGVEFATRQGTIMLDMQYAHGLSSFINTPVVDLKAKNNAFGVSIGYKIPIGVKAYGA